MVSLMDRKLIIKIKSKHKLANQRSAMTLLAIQGALLVILLTFVLILLFTAAEARHQFYLPVICFLLAILLSAVFLNASGRYRISTLITVVSVIVTPWISILFDPLVQKGDLVPDLAPRNQASYNVRKKRKKTNKGAERRWQERTTQLNRSLSSCGR